MTKHETEKHDAEMKQIKAKTERWEIEKEWTKLAIIKMGIEIERAKIELNIAGRWHITLNEFDSRLETIEDKFKR